MNGEFLAVLDYYEKEKGIDRRILIEAVETALLTASKKSIGPARDLRVEFDPKTGNIRAYATLTVVDHVASRHDQISVSQARQRHADAKVGDDIEVEVTPTNFGRIAAQTAKQAMLQRIRQAERDKIFQDYQDREGDIVTGIVNRFERGDVVIDLGGAEAILPQRERVPTEEYTLRERLRAYVLSIRNTQHGPEIILSRSHPGFVRRLFELEVSEIYDGTVEIKAIAREAGYRTKVAVLSHDDKVDPVGACVGMRGVRVKNIVRELNGEKIDIVRWNPDIRVFVTEALQPARFRRLEVDEKAQRVRIIVDEAQLSLAIGRRGQNARLASKLTGWRVDIEREISPEMAFEQKVREATEELARQLAIDAAVAETLVQAGIMSVEGVQAVDANDLIGVGLSPEMAASLIERAAAIDLTSASFPPAPATSLAAGHDGDEAASQGELPPAPLTDADWLAAEAAPSPSSPEPADEEQEDDRKDDPAPA